MTSEKVKLARECVLLLGALIALFQLIFSNEARRHDWLQISEEVQTIRQEISEQLPPEKTQWANSKKN